MLYLNDHLQDLNLSETFALLSPQRLEQALKYKFEMGQRTCVAAYLLLCEALAKEYGITERPIFEYGEHGKPSIIGHPDIHFNLSHCHEAAICYVSDRPVGVDVESVRPLKEGLMNYTMNDDEIAQIREADQPSLQFIRFWTMKEALLKLTGEGINDQLKDVLRRSDVQWHTTVSPSRQYVYSICQFL